jgi:hypothetical protein
MCAIIVGELYMTCYTKLWGILGIVSILLYVFVPVKCGGGGASRKGHVAVWLVRNLTRIRRSPVLLSVCPESSLGPTRWILHPLRC